MELDRVYRFIDSCINLVLRHSDITLYLITVAIILASILSFILPEPYYTRDWIVITNLGSSTAYIAYGLILYYFIDPSKAYDIIIVLIASGFLNIMIKDITALPRPLHPRIPVHGYSFPSGHAQSSSTFWTSAYILYPKTPTLILAIVMTMAISASRVILNVHYVRDVIYGALIGIAVGILLTLVMLAIERFNKLIWYVLMHFTLSIIMILTYLVYHDLMLVKFSGFLIGGLAHPILHSKVGLKNDSRLTQLLKFSFSAIVILVLSKLSIDPITAFISSLLIGLTIPYIKFKI